MKENSLEILTPEYVRQANKISQSMYDCGANARKLIAMAMALIPLNPDKESKDYYTVKFTISDFIKALNITDGSRTRDLIRLAVVECQKSFITIQDDDDAFILMPWFTRSTMDIKKGFFEMEFNKELALMIAELKGNAKLNLIDMGKLQGKYAIRFYELAMSYAGFAGKNGNKHNCWYFERSIDEMRLLFGVGDKKYKATKDFRVRVIDQPIKELNTADVGFQIESEIIRKGKSITGFRFCCQYEKNGEKIVTPPAESLTDKENEKLKIKYPKQWEKYYQEELSQTPLFPTSPTLWDLSCQSKAFNRLRELKGIRK